MALTRTVYQTELTRLQNQIESSQNNLTRLKIQEQLAKIFLDLSEPTPGPIWVSQGQIKTTMESSSAFFRLERSGEVLLTVFRHDDHYWVDPTSGDPGRIRSWTESNELKNQMRSDQVWITDGPLERTSVSVEKWLVHPVWTFPAASVDEPTPQPILTVDPSNLSSVQPMTIPAMTARKFTTVDLIKSMAQSFLEPTSPTAGMGLQQRTSPDEVMVNPGLIGDLSSPDIIQALAKARQRAVPPPVGSSTAQPTSSAGSNQSNVATSTQQSSVVSPLNPSTLS